MVESLKVSTKVKTERIAKYAFDFALKNGRKKVTIIHKANIMYVSFTHSINVIILGNLETGSF